MLIVLGILTVTDVIFEFPEIDSWSCSQQRAGLGKESSSSDTSWA